MNIQVGIFIALFSLGSAVILPAATATELYTRALVDSETSEGAMSSARIWITGKP